MLIKLSAAELNVLDDMLDGKLPSLSINVQGGDYLLDVPEEAADVYRNDCMDQLEISGFDIEYKLTPRGVILESLIDKFFTG